MLKPHLTERMKAIVDMTDRCFAAADIGTDHALVASALALYGKADKVYACDINEGPLKTAQKNIEKFKVQDKVETVLSPGLKFAADKADTVIIAGMGGELISDILSEYSIEKIKSFILQPMNRADSLRRTLLRLSLKIEDEVLVKDGGRIYCVMRACHGRADYSKAEILAGPYVIKKRGPLFDEYIRRIIKYEKSKTADNENGFIHEENVTSLTKIL